VTDASAGAARVPKSEAPVLSLGIGDAVIAFDVGGTDTKSALLSPNGDLVGLTRASTPHRGTTTAIAVLEHLNAQRAEFARDFPSIVPAAVGMIAPGLVDDDLGIGINAANLRWRDVPFKKLLEESFRLPASFSHDVRAAGEAEFQLGAARPFRNFVVVVVGTGIAASLFIEGRAYSAEGFAGELGHSVVDPNGELCACGARGCLETIASAGAIARRYFDATGVKPAGSREVIQRASEGDPVASQVWNDALDALALSIAQVTAVLSPEAVIVGGGLAQAGDALFVPLRVRVDRHLSFHRRPQILPALLGENAGLLGAALRARGASHKMAFRSSKS